MATNQQLQDRISDLENDIRELTRVIAEAYVTAKQVTYEDDRIEATPAYALGRIQGGTRMAALRCVTISMSDWIETLDKSLEQVSA